MENKFIRLMTESQVSSVKFKYKSYFQVVITAAIEGQCNFDIRLKRLHIIPFNVGLTERNISVGLIGCL